MSNQIVKHEIPSQETLREYLISLHSEAVRALSEAYQNVEADPGAAMNALQVANEKLSEIEAFAEHQAAIIVTMAETLNETTKQRDILATELDELQDNYETHAKELSDAMTEAELEHILGCEECLDAARTNWFAERMADEGVEAVTEELRHNLEQQLAQAKKWANEDFNNSMPLPGFEDETEDEQEVA